MLDAKSKPATRRFHELDAMRGVAAVAVVFSHCCNLLYPTAIFGTIFQSFTIYPFFAAHEAVMFFFLLSGFVLALPFAAGKKSPYRVFIVRRLLRIYGPYLGALLLSIAACHVWHHPRTSAWPKDLWISPASWANVGRAVLFVGNYPYSQFNLAFWSLVYEMRVSLIFPFLFLMARRLGTYGTLGAIALCTWLGVRDPSSGLTRLLGHQTVVTFEYIGIFLLGLLVARNLSSLETWYRGLGKFWRTGFGLVSFLLYFESHLLNQRWFWHFGDMLIAVGAAGGLLIVLCSKVAHTVLTHPIPAFLGRISYSLYLVHGTLLVGLYYAFHKRLTGMWFLALFFPLCALLAWGFYETVEAPFMRKSQQVGRSAKTPQTEVATVV